MSDCPRSSLKFGEHPQPDKDHATFKKSRAHLKQFYAGHQKQSVDYPIKLPTAIEWNRMPELNIPHQREAMAAILMLALSMNTGCASIVKLVKSDDEIARHAFQRDDYLEAEEYANPELCKKEKNMCEITVKGVNSIIDHHIQQITELTNKSFKENDYLVALEHCERAKELLKEHKRNGKRLEAVLNGEKKIRKMISEFTTKYKQTLADLEKQSGKAETLDEAEMSKVKAQFMRLKLLADKIDKSNRTLKQLADKFAQRLYDKKQYLKANTAIQELVKEVDGQFNEDDELFLATVRFKAIPEIKELIRSAEIALINRRYQEAVRWLIVPKEFNPSVKGLRDRIAVVDRKVKRKTKKKRRWRTRRKSTPPPSPPVVKADPTPTPTEEELSDMEEKAAVNDALREIKGTYASGNKFEALADLEEAIDEFAGSKHQKALLQQRKKWSVNRKKLIGKLVNEAEGKFPSYDAFPLFQQVLMLDSSHDLAQDRIRKLTKLKKLKEKQENGD